MSCRQHTCSASKLRCVQLQGCLLRVPHSWQPYSPLRMNGFATLTSGTCLCNSFPCHSLLSLLLCHSIPLSLPPLSLTPLSCIPLSLIPLSLIPLSLNTSVTPSFVIGWRPLYSVFLICIYVVNLWVSVSVVWMWRCDLTFELLESVGVWGRTPSNLMTACLC